MEAAATVNPDPPTPVVHANEDGLNNENGLNNEGGLSNEVITKENLMLAAVNYKDAAPALPSLRILCNMLNRKIIYLCPIFPADVGTDWQTIADWLNWIILYYAENLKRAKARDAIEVQTCLFRIKEKVAGVSHRFEQHMANLINDAPHDVVCSVALRCYSVFNIVETDHLPTIMVSPNELPEMSNRLTEVSILYYTLLNFHANYLLEVYDRNNVVRSPFKRLLRSIFCGFRQV